MFQQHLVFQSNEPDAVLPSARVLARRAAAQVAQKAERLLPQWTEQALQAMCDYALLHPQFTTEEVRLASPQVPAASDSRAWGQIVMLAQGAGICRPTQQFSKSTLRGSHGRDIRIWASAIYREDV